MAFPPSNAVRVPDRQSREPWTPPHQTEAPSDEGRYALQRTFEEFYRRSGVLGSGVARGVLDTVTPAVTVGRDWQTEELDLWAFTADQANTLAGQFPAIGILAGDREVLVRRWEWMLTPTNTNAYHAVPGAQVHLTKALNLAVYDPVDTNTGEFFPFVLTTPGFVLPRCRILAGEHAGLPSVLIGGVLVAPAIGPRAQATMHGEWITAGIYRLSRQPIFEPILNFSDPPIVIRPGEFLYMQSLIDTTGNPITGTTTFPRLWVNAWYTERKP